LRDRFGPSKRLKKALVTGKKNFAPFITAFSASQFYRGINHRDKTTKESYFERIIKFKIDFLVVSRVPGIEASHWCETVFAKACIKIETSTVAEINAQCTQTFFTQLLHSMPIVKHA